MSTGSLPRPGVDIEQVITPATPTILAPSLVPCVVGPCFAILEPLAADGSLNSTAEVSIPAVLKSASTLGTLVSVASEVLALQVDDDAVQVITLPAVASGSNLKTASLAPLLEAKLTGVTVRLVDNKLVFTSKTQGATSRLKFWSRSALVAASIPGVTGSTDMAHVELGLDSYEDEDYYGQGAYKNQEYVVPFDKLPTDSHHPSADQLVFDSTKLDFYRSFNSKLTALSTSSAVNWTSYLTGATKHQGNAVAFEAPSTFKRTSLFAKDSTGTSTNKVFDPGTEASITIPCVSQYAWGTNYPDASGSFSIYLEALGAQNFLSDQAQSVGAYAGAAGNELGLVFADTPFSNTQALNFNAGTKNYTLDYDSTSTTWQDVEDLFTNSSVVPTTFYSALIIVEDSYASSLFDGGGALNGLTFKLSGGRDPVDFGADPSTGIDDEAVIVGSIGLTDTVVATQQGKTLTLTANGGKAQSVTIPSTLADLVTAIDNLDDISCTSTSIYSAHENGLSGNSVRITCSPAGDYVGHASSLDMSGDPGVIESLFGGFLSKTETLTNGTGAGPVAGTLDPGASNEYNLSAATKLEKALVPDTVTLTLGSLVLNAHAVTVDADPGVSGIGYDLALLHSSFTPGTGPDAGVLGGKISFNFTAGANAAATALDINTQLASVIDNDTVTPLSTYVGAVAVKLSDDTSADHIALYDKSNTAGTVLSFLTTDGTTPTDPAWITAQGPASFDVALTTVSGSMTIADNSASSLLPMTATPSTSFPAPSGFSLLDESGSMLTDNYVDYGIGEIVFALQPELVYSTSWTQQLSYTRGAANLVSTSVQSFEGILWTGRSTKIVSGDRLFNAGSAVASIVKVENHAPSGAPSGWGDGSMLVLSTDAVTKGASMASWYVRAENLASSGGRTIPEVVVNLTTSEASLRGSLNRGDDGIPLSGSASLYAGYTALRLDVSDKASNPALLVFADTNEVTAQIGPITPTNPLAWACYTALLNSPVTQVSALGISSVTANAPEGTVSAYESAFNELEKVEIYSLIPLTQDMGVVQLANTHALAMSQPTQRKERIAICCPKLPTEEPSILAASGNATASEVSSNVYQFDFGDTVNLVGLLDGKKDANGNVINAGVGSTFTVAQGVFLTRENDPFKYLVTRLVSAGIVEVDLDVAFDEDQGPGSFGNDDAYYYTSENYLVNFEADGETCTLEVRQPAIDLTTTAGKNKAMSTLAEIAGGPTGFQSKRLIFVQPETVSMDYDGQEVLVSGNYLCAGIGAMIAGFEPSKPFTNLNMTGFIRPFGSSDIFSDNQMGIAAAGGIYWVLQDVDGAPLASRHQLTTDMSGLTTRELSVVKSIDYVAKTVRLALRRYIGRFNITPGLIGQISNVLQAVLRNVVGSAVQTAEVNRLEVNPDSQDEVLVDLTLTPYYPNNRIRVRIIV